jgi:hypothetical protein
MDRRLWFDLHTTVLHAEHALTRAAHPALIQRDGPSPLLVSNGIPTFTDTPAARASHADDLTTGDAVTDIAVRFGPDRPLRLPLQARASLTGTPLRDLLRRGARDGHRWFTVDVDTAGLRAVTTEPVRDGEPPASAVWRDAHLTAAGLSTYPGQTCPGHRLHGGAPPAAPTPPSPPSPSARPSRCSSHRTTNRPRRRKNAGATATSGSPRRSNSPTNCSTCATARMLAVVSDGQYSGQIDAAQRLTTTLHRTGCAVLWLHPGDSRCCHTYTHTTTVAVTNPISAIDVIADAAVTALTPA